MSSVWTKKFPDWSEITCRSCDSDYCAHCGVELGGKGTKLTPAGSDTDNSSEDSTEAEPDGSIKDNIKKVMDNWDNEAIIRVFDDEVIIERVPNPLESDLVLSEFENILYDSINITEYNPDTINRLEVSDDKGTFIVENKSLIKKYGVNKKVIDDSDSLYSQFYKSQVDSGFQIELKTVHHPKWVVGKWSRVYIPSQGLDDYYFINKVNHELSTDDKTVSLTLVPYPPDLNKDDSEEEDTTTEE